MSTSDTSMSTSEVFSPFKWSAQRPKNTQDINPASGRTRQPPTVRILDFVPLSILVEAQLQPCLVETSRIDVLKRTNENFALTRIARTVSVPQQTRRSVAYK